MIASKFCRLFPKRRDNYQHLIMKATIEGLDIKIHYPIQSYLISGNFNPDSYIMRNDAIIPGGQYIYGMFCPRPSLYFGIFCYFIAVPPQEVKKLHFRLKFKFQPVPL